MSPSLEKALLHLLPLWTGTDEARQCARGIANLWVGGVNGFRSLNSLKINKTLTQTGTAVRPKGNWIECPHVSSDFKGEDRVNFKIQLRKGSGDIYLKEISIPSNSMENGMNTCGLSAIPKTGI